MENNIIGILRGDIKIKTPFKSKGDAFDAICMCLIILEKRIIELEGLLSNKIVWQKPE